MKDDIKFSSPRLQSAYDESGDLLRAKWDRLTNFSKDLNTVEKVLKKIRPADSDFFFLGAAGDYYGGAICWSKDSDRVIYVKRQEDDTMFTRPLAETKAEVREDSIELLNQLFESVLNSFMEGQNE